MILNNALQLIYDFRAQEVALQQQIEVSAYGTITSISRPMNEYTPHPR
jgi:hypothetical protein